MVIDNSRAIETIRENRAVVAELASTWSRLTPILYIGARESERFSADLAKASGADPSTVSFLLNGLPEIDVNTGAARNLHLLLTSGSLCLTVDDDVLCELYAGVGPRRKSRSPFERYSIGTFYLDRLELEKDIVALDLDILAVHEQILGKKVSRSAKASSVRKTDTGPVSATIQGVVRATVTGVAGDLTNDSPAIPYFGSVGAGSFAPNTKEQHARLLESGQVLRLVNRHVTGRRLLTSAYCLGLDNANLLPPWLPSLRSQDRIFGMMLSGMDAGNLASLLPCAVMHDRLEKRTFDLDHVKQRFLQVSGGELMCGVLLKHLRACHDAAPTLLKLGEMIVQFALADISTFIASLTEVAYGLIQRRIEFLRSLLVHQADYPNFISDEIRHYLAAATAIAKGPSLSVPFDVSSSPASPAHVLKRLLLGYGNGLRLWVPMMDAAKQLTSCPSTYAARF